MEIINVQVRSHGHQVELFFKDSVWTLRDGHSSYDDDYRLNRCKPVDASVDIDAYQAIQQYEEMYGCILNVVRNLR